VSGRTTISGRFKPSNNLRKLLLRNSEPRLVKPRGSEWASGPRPSEAVNKAAGRPLAYALQPSEHLDGTATVRERLPTFHSFSGSVYANFRKAEASGFPRGITNARHHKNVNGWVSER
jgi:hypothetical protein